MSTGRPPAQPYPFNWFLFVGGGVLIAVTPWLWWIAPTLLWVACPLVAVWSVWLVVQYLAWARTLGK